MTPKALVPMGALVAPMVSFLRLLVSLALPSVPTPEVAPIEFVGLVPDQLAWQTGETPKIRSS